MANPATERREGDCHDEPHGSTRKPEATALRSDPQGACRHARHQKFALAYAADGAACRWNHGDNLVLCKEQFWIGRNDRTEFPGAFLRHRRRPRLPRLSFGPHRGGAQPGEDRWILELHRRGLVWRRQERPGPDHACAPSRRRRDLGINGK